MARYASTTKLTKEIATYEQKIDYFHNLYYLQHEWLPLVFYGSRKGLKKDILDEQGQLFVDLFLAMHEGESDYKCPFSAGDFQFKSCTLGVIPRFI